MKKNITITIKNSTGSPMPLSLFSKGFNSFNQSTTYQYDLEFETFPPQKDTISIQVRTPDQVDFQTFTAPIDTLSLQGFADALSSLGLGSFYVVDDQYIQVDSDQLIFGDMDTFASANVIIYYLGNIISQGFTIKVDGQVVVQNPLIAGSILVRAGALVEALLQAGDLDFSGDGYSRLENGNDVFDLGLAAGESGSDSFTTVLGIDYELDWNSSNR
jgi:hypothetical protein